MKCSLVVSPWKTITGIKEIFKAETTHNNWSSLVQADEEEQTGPGSTKQIQTRKRAKPCDYHLQKILELHIEMGKSGGACMISELHSYWVGCQYTSSRIAKYYYVASHNNM